MGGVHDHGDAPDLPIGRVARAVLIGFLSVTAIAVLIGLVLLWPDSDQPRIPYADDVTFVTATVKEVGPPCPVRTVIDGDTSGAEAFPEDCNTALVDAGQPELTRVPVPSGAGRGGMEAGDKVRLMRFPAGESPESWGYVGVERTGALGVLVLVFVLVVVGVARLRGLLALVALAIAAAVFWFFMFPALLTGSNGPAVAVVGSSAIMFLVLYLAHGPSMRTSAALTGTLLGIAVTVGVGAVATSAARLSDESNEVLLAHAPALNFHGLLLSALVVSGLGILNDVTITQASAVWELRAHAPDATRRSIYTSAMRIGRDHIASSIYTIVFAYAGAALALLLLLQMYARPWGDVLATESFAQEIVVTLTTAVGLVLAVPLTTAVSTWTVGGASSERMAPRRSGSRAKGGRRRRV